MRIEAVDVGYQNTKYVHRVDDAGRIYCRSFPSIAPVASDRELGVEARRETFIIPVGKTRYEVGPDASLAQGMFETRNLDDQFIFSDTYTALVRAALRMRKAADTPVDLLMVGLPVSLFRSRAADLQKHLQGDHDLGEGRLVRVHRVKALAQPMGAFLSYAVPNDRLDEMLRLRSVVADAGSRTFDWIVTEGLKVLDKRSDAVNKGMHDVVASIGRAIAMDLDVRLSQCDYERIDEALRNNTNPRFCGKPIDLRQYLDVGRRVARDAVTALRQLIQDGNDIDQFVIAGGGAFFYKREIEAAYPKHRILHIDEPMYANVRGFYIAGQEIASAEQRRVQARLASAETTAQ